MYSAEIVSHGQPLDDASLEAVTGGQGGGLGGAIVKEVIVNVIVGGIKAAVEKGAEIVVNGVKAAAAISGAQAAARANPKQ